jgi:hypothetical protein
VALILCGKILTKYGEGKYGVRRRLTFHSKSCLLDLIEINNFSKEYHHSNPYYLEMPINPSELRSYVQRTISMIRKI